MVSIRKKKQQSRKLSTQLDCFDCYVNMSHSASSENQGVPVKNFQTDPESIADSYKRMVLTNQYNVGIQT